MNKMHQIYPTEKKMQEPDRQKVRGYKQILLETKALRRRRNLSYQAIQHAPELVNSNIVFWYEFLDPKDGCRSVG